MFNFENNGALKIHFFFVTLKAIRNIFRLLSDMSWKIVRIFFWHTLLRSAKNNLFI